MPGDCVIRIPYLTKEQIEAEGWKLRGSEFSKNIYKCNYDETKLIIWEISGDILYKGNCKCINQFKLITKLLKI